MPYVEDHKGNNIGKCVGFYITFRFWEIRVGAGTLGLRNLALALVWRVSAVAV